MANNTKAVVKSISAINNATETSDRDNTSRPGFGEHDIMLNDIKIHYTVRGKGPVLLAISGGPGFDARLWDDFGSIDDFTKIVAMHPRGSGLSGPAPQDTDYTLPHYAADVETLRAYLGIAKPIVMGWSHGGMIALQFAFTYPDSLSKLILIDTSAYFGEFMGDVDKAVQAFRDKPWFEKSYAALKKDMAGDYRTDDDMKALWAEEMKFYFHDFNDRAMAFHERTKDYPVSIAPLKCWEKEMPVMDLRPHLKDIKVPTLVIVGRHDFITTVPMAEVLAGNIRAARLEIFEKSGHCAIVEEQEKFYCITKKFINDG